jgi:hypothetical protein
MGDDLRREPGLCHASQRGRVLWPLHIGVFRDRRVERNWGILVARGAGAARVQLAMIAAHRAAP